MSMNAEFLNTDLKTKKSTLQKCADLTTYNYMCSKYDNFRAYIAELSIIHEDLNRLSSLLNVLQIEEFRAMIIPKLINAMVFESDHNEPMRNKECTRVLENFCLDHDFDPDLLTPTQKDKLIRYCVLFCVLLSD
jgi:hypothetical protein